MKPGTLFALNRNLCVPLPLENRFQFVGGLPCPSSTRDQTQAAPSRGPGLDGLRLPERLPPPRSRSGWRRLFLALGLAGGLILTHGFLLGRERIAQARERHQLGLQIAAQELRAQELLAAHRQHVGALLARSAPWRQEAADRTALARRSERLPMGPGSVTLARHTAPATSAPAPGGRREAGG